MGATQGSITCTKFFVRDTPKRGFRDRFIEAAQKHTFVELRVEDEEEQHAGFCVFEKPFDLEIRHDNAYFNSFLNLSLRVDRWRVPSAIFKAHYREAEQAQKDKLGVAKLGRRQKEDLKMLVTRKLRRKTLPTMRVYELSWDLTSNVVRFWNTSPAVLDLFEELFEKAFGHKLMRDGAYVSCERRGLSEQQLERLLKAEPAHFAGEEA